MTRSFAVAAFLALVAPCCPAPAVAQTSMTEATGVNSVLGLSPSTGDFVNEAARSDLFEIRAGQIAVERGGAAIATFAARMIAEHEKTAAELKAMVASGAVRATVPDAVSDSQQSMLDKLKSMSGDAFNRQYGSDQVAVHKDAVSLFGRYAKGGDDDALKAWAAKMLPELETHLKMAQDLLEK